MPRATSIENKETLMDVKKIYSWKKKKSENRETILFRKENEKPQYSY